jgi:hypothetical protein
MPAAHHGYRSPMTSNRPGVAGMASTPHPSEEGVSPEAQSLPAEEHIDGGRIEEDLAEAPDEKHNATDGYAPAEDPDDPDTLEMGDELQG